MFFIEEVFLSLSLRSGFPVSNVASFSRPQIHKCGNVVHPLPHAAALLFVGEKRVRCLLLLFTVYHVRFLFSACLLAMSDRCRLPNDCPMPKYGGDCLQIDGEEATARKLKIFFSVLVLRWFGEIKEKTV